MYKHILFPYDASTLAHEAEKECIALAKFAGAKVTAINVIRHQSVVLEEGAPPEVIRGIESGLDAALRVHARTTLSDLQKRFEASGISCDVVVALGDEPYEAIIEEARRGGCDVIVMASHGRAPLDALVHGSQTMQLLNHCHIPVLVCRAH